MLFQNPPHPNTPQWFSEVNHCVLQLKEALEPVGKLRAGWQESRAWCPDLEV